MIRRIFKRVFDDCVTMLTKSTHSIVHQHLSLTIFILYSKLFIRYLRFNWILSKGTGCSTVMEMILNIEPSLSSSIVILKFVSDYIKFPFYFPQDIDVMTLNRSKIIRLS